MDIQQHQQLKVLLLGDDCVDVYRYGVVERLSPEAPIPIFKPTAIVTLAGMGGNVAKNLRTLGCEVDFISHSQSQKTRLIDQKSKQQLIRIDEDIDSPPLNISSTHLHNYDCVVVSDYNKGCISESLIIQVRDHFDGPIFVDTKKKHLKMFEGCFVKINQQEYNQLSSAPSDLIVTRGEQGVTYKERHWSAVNVDVIDVTGAGDTFLASLAYQYMITKDIASSIPFAIKASTVTVQHVGTYAPSLEEINAIKWND